MRSTEEERSSLKHKNVSSISAMRTRFERHTLVGPVLIVAFYQK